jgi:hypothetical protein
MEILSYIKKIFKPALSTVLVIYCLLNVLTTVAEEYNLEILAKLPTLSTKNKIILIPLPHGKKDKNQYLLADEKGELSLLSGAKLLSLSRLPLSNQNNLAQVKLTAFTLHPSFSLADKPGYQTFFTAHIEPKKTNNNVARLTLLEDPVTLPFDAVVTQWQYDSSAPVPIDKKQRREVIRIAVPSLTHHIQKIAFNPYNKVWHDDYGLMHIALSDSVQKQSNASASTLYSGVVLRINPAKFGLRNYRTPSSNPFMKTNSINNEIFILGAQNINSFSWSKQHYGALLIEHTYEGVHQVAVAEKGADWRDSYQKKLVFTLKPNQWGNESIFPYYGRSLKNSVGNILYLANNAKNWQLAQFNTAIKNGEVKEEFVGQAIGSFNKDELSPANKVSLLLDHAGEPLLLDYANKRLLSIQSSTLVIDKDSNIEARGEQEEHDEQADTVNSNAYGNLLLILFISVVAVVFYRLRPKSNAVKAKLSSQFARFELDSSQTALLFYKRHQSEVDSQLAIADIVKSEISINDNMVSTINKDNDHGYNEQRENQLRLNFTKAHQHKLINDEIREVQLYLTDLNTKEYVICLYLRKGNHRLTKAKYFDTLESLIDWSWFIAKQLNPQATQKRKIKAAVFEPPIIKALVKVEQHRVINKEIESVKEHKSAEELHNITIHDSELINSLDRLAELKQKGFLNEEEFSLAKAKILSDITDNK